jgi:hypothetical protein
MTAGASESGPDWANFPRECPLLAAEILQGYGWFEDSRAWGTLWYLSASSRAYADLTERLMAQPGWDGVFGRTLEQAWELTFGENPLAF